MLIARSAILEQPLTLKELFNSLKYSERGIRYVLEHFVDSGWCEVVGHERDKRFRLVVATGLMIIKLQQHEQHFLNVYSELFSLSAEP